MFIDAEIMRQIGVSGPKTEIKVNCVRGLSKLTEIEYVGFSYKGSKVHEIKRARSISGLEISTQSLVKII